jgi:hypothetical protein
VRLALELRPALKMGAQSAAAELEDPNVRVELEPDRAPAVRMGRWLAPGSRALFDMNRVPIEEVVKAVRSFDDRRVTTVQYQGKNAWIAREVGAALGYAQAGKRFASRSTGKWSREFVFGKDHAVLTGREAALLQQAVEAEGTDAASLRSAAACSCCSSRACTWPLPRPRFGATLAVACCERKLPRASRTHLMCVVVARRSSPR